MPERPGYDEFLKNVKRVRLTRAGLLKIMRENEQREAEKAKRLQQSQDAAQSSDKNSGADGQ